MPSKRSGKRITRGKAGDRTNNFVTWKARAAAELKRQHNVNPGIISARMWKHLYHPGQDAAEGCGSGGRVRLQRAIGCRSAEATMSDESSSATAPTKCSAAPSTC
jgi:hypothetical protein